MSNIYKDHRDVLIETFAKSASGTNTTSLHCRFASRGRSGATFTNPSRRHNPSLIPPVQLSNAVCGE